LDTKLRHTVGDHFERRNFAVTTRTTSVNRGIVEDAAQAVSTLRNSH